MNRVSRRTAGIVAGGCLAAILVAVPSAQATVTESAVNTPEDVSYPVFQYDSPNSIAVSGTSSGHAGDHVDLLCYYANTSWTMATNVLVHANGTFSVPAAPLATPPYVPCRLRAIPSGTAPGNLNPFVGPRLLVGEHRNYRYASGPNNGKLYDYYLYFQQLGGGFDYDSVSACGVCDGYLTDPQLDQGPVTFWSNAALFYLKTGPILRSEVQVDGANAYPPNSAEQINVNAIGPPTVTYSYSQNQKTGDAVIHETDQLVKCADPTYPPTTNSCASFESAGVSDTVTMTQDHSGRIAWASDVFRSTDGKAHSLDLLWDNNQRFTAQSGDSSQLEYEFPGQSGYSTHVLSDTVNLASGPGTIFIRMHGAPDGDPSTGQGAIVYDRTASQAKFRNIQSYVEAFTLHQTGTVPAKGSTRFRFAYVQAYKAADVAALAHQAATVFKGCTVPKVAGKSLAAAKAAIKHANCTVGKISHASSTTVAAGHVISSKPKAKTHVDYGTRVTLVISKGR